MQNGNAPTQRQERALTPEYIKCHRCGHELGQVIEDGIYMIGGVVIYESHGVCANCGAGFHYSTKAAILQKILDEIYKEKLRERQSCQKSTPN